MEGHHRSHKGGKFVTGNSPILANPRSVNNTNMSQPPRISQNSNQQRVLGARPVPTRAPRNISNNDFNERRAKGLCFWCEEKYTPGHRCKKKQLYRIELVKEGTLEEVGRSEATTKVGETEPKVLDSLPQISLHTLAGQVPLPDFNTMRLSSTVKHRRVHILIDSGSTHNFLESTMASNVTY